MNSIFTFQRSLWCILFVFSILQFQLDANSLNKIPLHQFKHSHDNCSVENKSLADIQNNIIQKEILERSHGINIVSYVNNTSSFYQILDVINWEHQRLNRINRGTNIQSIFEFLACTPPIITATADRYACHNQVGATIVFQADIASSTFKWVKKSSSGGQATTIPVLGFGNIPTYTFTNTTCDILIDSIIVTPINKVSIIDSCLGIPDTFLIFTLPVPTISQIRDSSFCDGQIWTPPSLNGSCIDSVKYHWTKSSGPGGTTIPGLSSLGNGNIPTLTIVNPAPSCLILTDTIKVTPYYISKYLKDSCSGTTMKFIVKSVPSPVITSTRDTAYCTGLNPNGFNFKASCSVATSIKWKKTTVGGSSKTGTNIATSGIGNIPSFTTNNPGPSLRIDTIFVNATFVSVGDSCVGPTDTFLIYVIPTPTIISLRDTTYCHGTKIPKLVFTGTGAGVQFNWTRAGLNFGIPSSGIDSIPMFIVNNTGSTIIMNTITVTPSITVNGVKCSGSSFSFKISAYPQPVARCKSVNVYLNSAGTASLTMASVNNSSTGKLQSLSPSNFNCASAGINMVNLTVVDSCNNASVCVATVIVLDTIRPKLTCFDQVVNLQPSSCETRFNYLPTATDNCNGVTVQAQDTATYGVGKKIDIGSHNVCFIATDNSLNTSSCCINVQVNSFSNPIGSLACDDDVQISLDDNCSVTLSAEYFLKGGPYRCFKEYKVIVTLWSGGPSIDRDPIKPGVQLNASDIGSVLKVTILDPINGNSCWGKARVEDKQAPRLTCPGDITIGCDVNSSPYNLGVPIVFENCGNYTITYVDIITKGNCNLGVDKWIRRTWTAIDNSGNKSYCSQIITIIYTDINLFKMPLDFTGIFSSNSTHSLHCDNKYDPSLDFKKHFLPSPVCVDDYLLDHNVFIATGRRIPRALGWNIIASGPYAGHPNTESIYYPVHEDSTACWNSNEVVMWEGTGAPLINSCSNVGVTYTDLIISTSKPNCKAGDVGCYKLLRTWTILDWCSSKIRTHLQIILVEDTEGPQITYPDTISLVCSAFNCTANWEIKDVWVKDNCSEDVKYSITTTAGTVIGNSNSGFIIIDIPSGDYYASIIAEDCCGNVTEKRVLMHVLDKTPPTAICQTKTVASLVPSQSKEQSHTTINAISFDDGSFDNCAPHVYFKVIRMDEMNGTLNGSDLNSTSCNGLNGDDDPRIAGSQTYFDDDVKFCCSDVSLVRMVVFRVFDIDPGTGPILPSRMNANGDLFGHFSDCMVEVNVQNKSTPIIVAPSDVVVSCEWWLDIDKLKDPKDSLLGKMVDDIEWRRKIKTIDQVCQGFCDQNLITKYPGSSASIGTAPALACDLFNKNFDPIHPTRKYELAWGFDGYIISACGANFSIQVDDQRQCGQGKILRTYTAIGQNGQSVSATQTIWVVDCDPFYINSKNACDTLDDIVWPDCNGLGTYINTCNGTTSPDNIGKPQVVNGADDHCALIAIEYTDQIFTGEQDACYVILRKWVVIDWCQYDPHLSQTSGRWEFTQFIKVNDREKPVVSCTIGSCESALQNPRNGICYGHINLTATAIDACSPIDWLSFEYKIDLFNDGSIDYNVGSLNKKQFDAGEIPSIINNPLADNNKNPFDASGKYPIGIHSITWFVADGCGNIGTCSKLFEVKDCKAPTPYCSVGIITVPMPSTSCVDIWAKDLDYGSYDNCTSKDKLKLYFDGDRKKTSIRVCCDDFVKAKANDELRIDVKLYVEDEEGNRDYCSTVIIVQDNQNICKNVGSLLTVSGELKTEYGAATSESKVDIFNNGSIYNSKKTGNDGKYVFGDISAFTNYLVKPSRTDNPLNGVSTADIVKIQKHILGKELITSPFKLIAADVNNSRSISSADIAEIRKLILGTINQFSKVESWKFIPDQTIFEDVTEPWFYKTEANVSVLDNNIIQNFISVKMGDVNESVISNTTSNSKPRSNEKLKLVIEDKYLKSTQQYGVAFKVKDLVSIQGLQFTLNYNTKALQYSSFVPGGIDLKESNIGISHLDHGRVTFSWNANELLNLHPEDVIFTLNFDVIANAQIGDNMTISSDITAAEYYNASLDPGSIELDVRSGSKLKESGIFEIVSASPNPFREFIDIQFRIAEAEMVQCTIYDALGKVYRIIPISSNKGLNSIRINTSELAGAGIYYYQLDSKNNSITSKMILLD